MTSSLSEQYEQQAAELSARLDRNKTLGDGLVEGKVFRSQVADGYAFYEIARVNKTTVRVKWLDLHPDRWTDAVLGDGGSFPKAAIERMVRHEDMLGSLFG